MAREIKFRVWDTIEKTFYYDSDIRKTDNCCMVLHLTGDIVDIAYDRNEYHNHDMILEQFWKQDKNGKDVYVGDLVMFNYWSKPLEVKQDENCIYVEFEGGHNMPLSPYFELVGNIHEATK